MFEVVVGFLIILAIFDLVVGVSNDAVNFMNSGIGARVARFRTIVIVSALGVFLGAAMSNGMMDIARHGILMPEYFSFYEVMCVLLAVMVTDVILLDIFNTLGLPTSTTVSMVFELLGGAFALAILKISGGVTGADGMELTLGNLLNTEKAVSVVLGIFLSVAIAFVFGTLVQWIARLVFSFTYHVGGRSTGTDGKSGTFFSSAIKTGIFAGISVTSIIWFLLVKGLKSTTLMTPELNHFIDVNTWLLLGGGTLLFSLVMTLLCLIKVPVLKFVVLLGTFALAMAFASNDLVNFVGVPLTGLDALLDFRSHGGGDASGFMMTSLMQSAQTPTIYLVTAGVIMVLSLVFSKKAQNVVKTSVDLSRQGESDEMFGSSGVARVLVRHTLRTSQMIGAVVPSAVSKWIDSRFNRDSVRLEEGAAFDMVRASVNLVLAGILVAWGTSMKLPLSTTYVTFMVAMGTSLADRAWSRESAVFRITGVISVIGGWFITAGVAFIFCYILTNVLFFGRFVAMLLSMALVVFMLVRSQTMLGKKHKEEPTDTIFNSMMQSQDKAEIWQLLREHIATNNSCRITFVQEAYSRLTTAFFDEDYSTLRKVTEAVGDERKEFKRQRRREIIAMRRIEPMVALENDTWYFLANNSVSQMLYSLKRLGEPCREHVGNNFTPVSSEDVARFLPLRDDVVRLYVAATDILGTSRLEDTEPLRQDASTLQRKLSAYRKEIIGVLQTSNSNIESMSVLLCIVQESQELLSDLRHMLRGMRKLRE